MSFETILFETADRIATITLNRPDKLNALNDQVIGELGRAADMIASDASIRGVIVTGAGPKAFAAGADISELASQGPMDGKARALRGQAVFRRFETLPVPVVAAVNGFALGGGCELALACHIRIAADTARFGQPELKLGITPGYGGTQRLPRIVGRGRALEIILSGRMVSADEAHRIGLVNEVVPAASLLDRARELLQPMQGMAPLAVALTIEAVDHGLESTLEEGLLLEANHFGLLSASSDMKEGMAAFLQKRAATFHGR